MAENGKQGNGSRAHSHSHTDHRHPTITALQTRSHTRKEVMRICTPSLQPCSSIHRRDASTGMLRSKRVDTIGLANRDLKAAFKSGARLKGSLCGEDSRRWRQDLSPLYFLSWANKTSYDREGRDRMPKYRKNFATGFEQRQAYPPPPCRTAHTARWSTPRRSTESQSQNHCSARTVAFFIAPSEHENIYSFKNRFLEKSRGPCKYIRTMPEQMAGFRDAHTRFTVHSRGL